MSAFGTAINSAMVAIGVPDDGGRFGNALGTAIESAVQPLIDQKIQEALAPVLAELGLSQAQVSSLSSQLSTVKATADSAVSTAIAKSAELAEQNAANAAKVAAAQKAADDAMKLSQESAEHEAAAIAAAATASQIAINAAKQTQLDLELKLKEARAVYTDAAAASAASFEEKLAAERKAINDKLAKELADLRATAAIGADTLEAQMTAAKKAEEDRWAAYNASVNEKSAADAAAREAKIKADEAATLLLQNENRKKAAEMGPEAAWRYEEAVAIANTMAGRAVDTVKLEAARAAWKKYQEDQQGQHDDAERKRVAEEQAKIAAMIAADEARKKKELADAIAFQTAERAKAKAGNAEAWYRWELGVAQTNITNGHPELNDPAKIEAARLAWQNETLATEQQRQTELAAAQAKRDAEFKNTLLTMDDRLRQEAKAKGAAEWYKYEYALAFQRRTALQPYDEKQLVLAKAASGGLVTAAEKVAAKVSDAEIQQVIDEEKARAAAAQADYDARVTAAVSAQQLELANAYERAYAADIAKVVAAIQTAETEYASLNASINGSGAIWTRSLQTRFDLFNESLASIRELAPVYLVKLKYYPTMKTKYPTLDITDLNQRIVTMKGKLTSLQSLQPTVAMRVKDLENSMKQLLADAKAAYSDQSQALRNRYVALQTEIYLPLLPEVARLPMLEQPQFWTYNSYESQTDKEIDTSKSRKRPDPIADAAAKAAADAAAAAKAAADKAAAEAAAKAAADKAAADKAAADKAAAEAAAKAAADKAAADKAAAARNLAEQQNLQQSLLEQQRARDAAQAQQALDANIAAKAQADRLAAESTRRLKELQDLIAAGAAANAADVAAVGIPEITKAIENLKATISGLSIEITKNAANPNANNVSVKARVELARQNFQAIKLKVLNIPNEQSFYRNQFLRDLGDPESIIYTILIPRANALKI